MQILFINNMRDTTIFRVAVTGSSGQLGTEFFRIAGNHPRFHFTFLTREVFPLDQNDKMISWLKENPVDIFIHCAAYTAVDKAEDDVDLAEKINKTGAENLAVKCKAHNAVLIHISTDFVFKGDVATPLTEDAAANPISVYGQTKLDGEKAVADAIRHVQDREHPVRQTMSVLRHLCAPSSPTLRLGAVVGRGNPQFCHIRRGQTFCI